MRVSFVSGLFAAGALAAAPVAAAAQPASNPASSLSIGHAARAGSTSAHGSDLAGGAGIFAVLIAAGIAAIVVIAVVNDSDNSDSP